jgi:hypothetical protein
VLLLNQIAQQVGLEECHVLLTNPGRDAGNTRRAGAAAALGNAAQARRLNGV